jgi:quinolinate synthase
VILWKGYCHVHTAFTVEDVQRARRSRPGCRVLVHPECIEAVVQAADGAGSTSYLVKAVAEARPGSILVIGTEVNLVSRLAAQHPDRTVVPLRRSLCPNMFRIGPGKLLQSLQSVPDRMEPVSLSEDLKTDARVALERMLSL